ncbi:hypothetical protein ACFV1N_48485 [Streptosporangium canum]|uniref:hypothetical protein n=1 Tax=Streptosporangium canum TaxID=324952 RepID=UPI0036AD03C6
MKDPRWHAGIPINFRSEKGSTTMGKISSEKTVGEHTIDGRPVQVQRIVWADGGLSYGLIDANTGTVLTTEESFDTYPSDSQMKAVLDSPVGTSAPADLVAAWERATKAHYVVAGKLARLIADTIRTQYPSAAYLALEIGDDETDRDMELFLNSIRDADGAIINDFEQSDALPPIDPDNPLRRAWGALNPSNAVALLWLLRQLYMAGVQFDELPEDLQREDDTEWLPMCLLLSGEARPHVRESEEDKAERFGPRLMRPYGAIRPSAAKA